MDWVEPLGERPVLVVHPARKNIGEDSDRGVLVAVRSVMGVVRVREGRVAGDLAVSDARCSHITVLIRNDGDEDAQDHKTRKRELWVTRSKRCEPA